MSEYLYLWFNLLSSDASKCACWGPQTIGFSEIYLTEWYSLQWGQDGEKTGHPQKISSSKYQGEIYLKTQDDLQSHADSCKVYTCKFCKHDFVDEDSALIICERCDACVCVPCANFSPSEYGILRRSTRKLGSAMNARIPPCLQLKKIVSLQRSVQHLFRYLDRRFRQSWSQRF